MYDFNDPVTLAVAVTDSNGAPANATTVVCTVTKPDGTTATPTVNNPVTGSYNAIFTPTLSGRHVVNWVATGANASAFNDIFDVRAGLSTSLLSLADAKATLNINATDYSQDEELRDYLEAVTAIVEGKTGAIIDRTVTEQVASYGSMLVLGTIPVKSITSLTNVQVSGWLPALTDLVADTNTGIVRRISRGSFGGEVFNIVYVAGRGNLIPSQASLAARIILKNVWKGQRGSGRGQNIEEIITGYLWPNQALEAINTLRIRIGGIA